MSGPNFAGIAHNFNFEKADNASPMSGNNEAITPANEQAPGSSGNPLETKAAEVAKEGQSPLDKFNALMDTTPKPELDDKGQPIKPVIKPTILDATPEALTTSVEKMDFTKGITSDALEKIAAGGEEGTLALLEVINNAGKAGYVQAASLAIEAGNLAKNSGSNLTAADVQTITTLDNSYNLLVGANPVYASEAFSGIAKGIQKHFLSKNPAATPQVLADMTKEYFSLASGKDSTRVEKEEDALPNIGDFFNNIE